MVRLWLLWLASPQVTFPCPLKQGLHAGLLINPNTTKDYFQSMPLIYHIILKHKLFTHRQSTAFLLIHNISKSRDLFWKHLDWHYGYNDLESLHYVWRIHFGNHSFQGRDFLHSPFRKILLTRRIQDQTSTEGGNLGNDEKPEHSGFQVVIHLQSCVASCLLQTSIGLPYIGTTLGLHGWGQQATQLWRWMSGHSFASKSLTCLRIMW